MVDFATITGQVTSIVGGLGEHFSSFSSSESIIFDIALILIISAIFAFIARMLRQPLIPAYVIAGLIVGPLVLGFVQNTNLIYAFSEIGIAFLLFTAGLEISFAKIREANLKKIALIGTLQVAIVFIISILVSEFFNLSFLQAAYIGIILAFGSTMVVIKLLADSGELITMHGRIILGILLLQDLVAIIAIVIFTSGGFALSPIISSLLLLLAIILIAILLQRYVLNKLFDFASHSTELLFLSALAVLFLFVILARIADISIVIGAFIAGVSLANSPFRLELESRISSLRDFFAILFFVALGMRIVFTGIADKLNFFFFLLLIAFIIKPIITFLLIRITGYTQKTSFLTSISLAQLSEFSLIISIIALNSGIFDSALFSTITLATIITMSITPYFIKYKNILYSPLSYPLKFMKFIPVKEVLGYIDKKPKKTLLIGAHRMGSILLNGLEKHKDELIVMDHNPEIIHSLVKKKVSCLYGNLGSPEMLHNLNIESLERVISTIPNFEENIYLIKKIKQRNQSAMLILTATRISEALDLYKKGADYVILPKVLAGEEASQIIKKEKQAIGNMKKAHIRELRKVHHILY